MLQIQTYSDDTDIVDFVEKRNKVKAFILLLTTTCIFPQSVAAYSATIQTRTACIYNRYYLIKRLKKACKLLQDIDRQKAIPFDQLNETLFKSNIIKVIAEEIKATKTLSALQVLWSDFCAYKEIYNDDFKRDFVVLIYMLYDLLCLSSIKHVRSLDCSSESIMSMIDSMYDTRRFEDRYFRVRQSDDPGAVEVTTDLVAKRFYVLRRLQKSMKLLNSLHERNFDFGKQDSMRSNSIDLIEEIERFHHDRVRESVIEMSQTNNLEPLILLCEEAKQYRFAQDENFLQEMLMNIFLAYKTILFKSSYQASPMIIHEMNQVLEIYEHLSTMPLDETLEAIDSVTDRLIAIQTEGDEIFTYKKWIFPGLLSAPIILGICYYFFQQG